MTVNKPHFLANLQAVGLQKQTKTSLFIIFFKNFDCRDGGATVQNIVLPITYFCRNKYSNSK